MSKRARRKAAASKRPKSKLGLPDLDPSKAAVLDSLRSPESKRGYRHAIDEFIQWYCAEPRLSFNKVVVTRYRIYLEKRGLAPSTINGRLAAVRRLAYEACQAHLELDPALSSIQQARAWFDEQCRQTGEFADGPYIRVSNLAQELGLADEHRTMSSFLSKLIHPTGFSICLPGAENFTYSAALFGRLLVFQ